MIVDLILPNVTVFNVENFNIRKGQKAMLSIGSYENKVKWFSDADQVLSISPKGSGVEITVTGLGETEIQIQDESRAILKKLKVIAFDEEKAVTLNPKSDHVELKVQP